MNSNNNYSSPTLKPSVKTCLFEQGVYDVYCLIPSILIISILSCMSKRIRLFKYIWNGRPALVIPMNFLGDSTSNRLSIAIAFGVIASNCFQLFSSITGFVTTEFRTVDLGNTPWEKAWSRVVIILVYGIINFPVLACLMADNKLIGSILGLLYTLMRFIAKMILVFSCKSFKTEIIKQMHLSSAYRQSMLFVDFPDIFCYSFLLVTFAMILRKEIIKLRTYTELVHRTNEEAESVKIAKEHDDVHVRLLFKNELSQRLDPTKKWYLRIKDSMYMTRPDFKYSTEVISTLTVGAIFVYHFTISFIIHLAYFKNYFKKFYIVLMHRPQPNVTNDSFLVVYVTIIEILADAYFVSTALTCLLLVILMLHFIKCHRSHVIKSYRTRLFLNRPSRLVGRSLSYPGYQIAHIAWGFLIMVFTLVVVWFVIILSIKYWHYIPWWELISPYLPYLVIVVVIWLFQYLLGFLVFRDRQFPDVTVTVDNHRLYCIVSFFFFFLNILVGFFSSILRTLKSLVLGVFFFSRIDRTPMMAGFHKWDKGYLSYIGFLNVLKSSSHPVMLVFCHLLTHLQNDMVQVLDGDSFIGGAQGSSNSQTAQRRFPSSRTVANRWLVAYTLLRNPSIRALRKHNLGRVERGMSNDNMYIVPKNVLSATDTCVT